MFTLKVCSDLNVVKFRQLDEHLEDLFELPKTGQERVKNYLALLKPKSLFLVLRWCSMQMGDAVAVFLVFFTRNILTLLICIFHIFFTLAQVSGG